MVVKLVETETQKAGIGGSFGDANVNLPARFLLSEYILDFPIGKRLYFVL